MEQDYAKMVNYRVHAGVLFIPLLNNLEVKETDEAQTILLASKEGLTEHVVSDGKLETTFEERVKVLEESAIEFMKQEKCIDAEKNYFYYKDETNGIFNYKIYVQNIINEIEGEVRITRMINVFFVEPRFNDLYEISMSAGPFLLDESNIILDKVDFDNDQITRTLYEVTKVVIDNLRYN